MTSKRATLSAVLASVGVLAAGWSVATADGRTLPATPTAPTTTTTPTTTTPPTDQEEANRTPTTPATATPASGASATTLVDGTYTGSTATHRFGSVTVTVTVSGGRISALGESVVSDGDRKSEQINNRSVPTVRSRVLSANSAAVATVSGATYTTRAYLTSLQSALDQAS